MTTCMFIYGACCIGIFGFSMFTAIEDVVIGWVSGPPSFPNPGIIDTMKLVVLIFVMSFIPPFNIGILALTVLYRRG